MQNNKTTKIAGDVIILNSLFNVMNKVRNKR